MGILEAVREGPRHANMLALRFTVKNRTMPIPPPPWRHSRTDSPLGTLVLARTPQGLCGAWFEGQRHAPAPERFAADQASPDDLLLQAAADLLQRLGVFMGVGQQGFATHPQLVQQLTAARTLRGEVEKVRTGHGMQTTITRGGKDGWR